MKDVLAATAWTSNADLIADCARLNYLQKDWVTLDPTYGKGNWWTVWRPDTLIEHDIKIDGVDFRNLPYGDGHFDAVAFDPPFVSVGGRSTTGIPKMHQAYGMDRAPISPKGVQKLINLGLGEAHRVVKPKGIVLCKVQDYISSGKLWLGTHYTLSTALELSFEPIDRLEYISGVRPQPSGRRQVHARRNLSTLFVLRKK